jgi:prepilin peptidase dependent protein B
MPNFHPVPSAHAERGLSIIELLVGVAIGLFIVAGAIKLTVDNLSGNRQLLVETRVNQDLRAAADIVARDLRRAGYWDDASTGLWSAGASVVSAVNPFVAVNTSTAETIVYSYDRPGIDPATNVTLGFRRTGAGVLQLRNGAGDWQPLTDPNAVTITEFSITPTARTVELYEFCICRTRVPVIASCEDATLSVATTRPQMIIRQYEISITGEAANNPDVVRQIRETVRVRNDELKNPNGCPAV